MTRFCPLLVTSLLSHVTAAVLQEAAPVCAEQPQQRVDCYPPSPNFPPPTEELCMAQGCCWKSLENDGVPCAFAALDAPVERLCANVANASRMACRNPRFASPKLLEHEACASAGCCYDDGECFQPPSDGYELLTLDETDSGWRGTLALRPGHRGPFGNDVPLLELHVTRQSATQVRIRITDPAFPRFEVPGLPIRRHEDKEMSGENECDYDVHFTSWPFGVAVTRRHSGEVLFNSTPPLGREDEGESFSGLVFENQFLEFSTQLVVAPGDDEPVLYGLGERVGPARLRVDKEGDLYPMFARAPNTTAPVHSRSGGDNLYGVHPFVLQLENGNSSQAHGMFVLSANALEAVARRDALTFRLTGGIIDVFVFSGPSPQDVMEQYTDVVGRPELPPYWALGYHVGNRGGEDPSADDALKIVTKLRLAGVPMDVYWQDIEYMADRGQAHSLDKSKVSRQNMRSFIDDLHFHGQYFVCVQAPAIQVLNLSRGSNSDLHGDHLTKYDAEARVQRSVAALHLDDDENDHEWDPMARGEELDVFVKGVDGERYAQKAFWSRWAVFVDFFHPSATQYWHEKLAEFHKYVLPYDGLWLDMNEPSSTCDCAFAAEGDICVDQCKEHHATKQGSRHEESSEVGSDDELVLTNTDGDRGFIRTNDVNFPFDPYRQPFVPGQSEPEFGGHGNLNSATLPMAALHYSSLHYNLHSLYGHTQAHATRHALDAILKKRSVLLSRSTFAGSGRFAGHWLGDDFAASWEQLRLSIAGTLQMNLLGVPLTGPNVCGARGQASTELCIRWHQAASFLPLLRNHAESYGQMQTPVDFDDDTRNILRSTLLRRYRYLPYMYTLFYEAHCSGSPVVRPLSFDFPYDKRARNIEHQYLLGPALMVSPVVHAAAISVNAYFPVADWYDAENGKMAMDATRTKESSDGHVNLLSPLPKLQLHIRGGYIVPTQQPLTTTTLSRRGEFTLIAALDTSKKHPDAAGQLYLDDGDSLSAVEEHRYSLMRFGVFQNSSNSIEFRSKRDFHGYTGPEMQADLSEIRVYGVYGSGFSSNSSLHATFAASGSEGPHYRHPPKADYFAQSNMLVLTRLDLPIGQDFYVNVEARSATDGKEKGADEEKSVDANASGQSGSGSSRGGASEEAPKKKSKYSTTSIVAIVAGGVILLAIVLIILVRRRRARRGYDVIG
ncbi:hypothetical protein PHYBOEH_002108 [Phytophthora boehmeriae]|uniref:P-type domain-containing protein n=1 Tax=Phytophthora boehmeriae TaxID=109152 RepID=A0A8T1X7I4_9STRA|nr:hypothetical protein PHYBOEH_002108 [Phytophthora boehmeriae]